MFLEKTMDNILPMLIEIEETFSRLYKNIGAIDGQYSIRLKTAATVLAKQEKEHADYYRKVKEELDKKEPVVVGDDSFLACSEIMDNFKSTIHYKSPSDITSFIKYAIRYEKENAHMLKLLLEDIRGTGERVNEFKSLIITLIEAENTHSGVLESFLPKGTKYDDPD